jgi:hypothetical protein
LIIEEVRDAPEQQKRLIIVVDENIFIFCN